MRSSDFETKRIFTSNQIYFKPIKIKPHHLWVIIKDDKNILPLQDIKSV